MGRRPDLGDLDAAIAAFTTAVAGSDPATAVASCPGWSVRDLVDHVGEVHRWAAHAVTAGRPDAVTQPAPAGLDAEGLADWYAEQAAVLRAAVADPTASAWIFGDDGPARAGWWVRRQTHELAVHLVDLTDAAGTPRPDLDPELAWDAVAEVATMFHPRQVRLGRTEALEVRLVLEARDLPGADAVVLGEGPQTTISGDAADLLLVLWRRRRLRDVDPAADPDATRVLEQALAGGLTP